MRHDPDTFASFYGVDPGLAVRCCCGRETIAGKMQLVTGFPAGVHPAGEVAVCDACFILPVYQGRVTHAAVVYYTGGAPAAVARGRAKGDAEVAAGNVQRQPDVLDAPRDGAGGGSIGALRGG